MGLAAVKTKGERTVMIIQRLAYSPEQAGQMLDVSREEVYQLMRRGQIRGYKHGKLTKIPHASLQAYVDRMMAQNPAGGLVCQSNDG